MVLGGAELPSEKGPTGHSDGDAVLHSIIDAILGAAALGDIGSMFPDDQPEYESIDSATLVKRAVRAVSENGWTVRNLDVNVILESPRLSPFIGAMRRRIAALLGVDYDSVSVKAKTNEGLGDVGRGEAVVCHAVVLLESIGNGS